MEWVLGHLIQVTVVHHMADNMMKSGILGLPNIPNIPNIPNMSTDIGRLRQTKVDLKFA